MRAVRAPPTRPRPPPRRPVRPGRVSAPRSVPAGVARPPYVATGGIPTSRALDPLDRPADVARLRAAGRAARRVLDRLAAEVAPGRHHRPPRRRRPRGLPRRGRLPVDARLPRLPEEPLHVGERGRRPRHPRRPPARGRRHRQLRRHHLPRRRARRLLPHVLRRRRRRRRPRAPSSSSRPPRRRCGPASPPCAPAAGCATSAGPSSGSPARRGYGIVRELVGHGIGEQFHGEPHVHHYDEPRNRPCSVPGMTFTIEPMLTAGHARRRACGTTGGRSPPSTACRRPSSSTPCSSPTTASRCSPSTDDGAVAYPVG